MRSARPVGERGRRQRVHVTREPAGDRNGFEAWIGDRRGYEGLVAKDESSLYEAGRTRRCLKVKQTGWTVEEDGWQRRISAGA